MQAERDQYGLAGALVLTAIQERSIDSQSFRFNMNDIWQVFSLFSFEIEGMCRLCVVSLPTLCCRGDECLSWVGDKRVGVIGT